MPRSRMESSEEVDSRFAALKNDDEYIAENIKDINPILKECFSSSVDKIVILRALRIAFGPCVTYFTLEELDEECLQYSCPAARKLYIETLEKIERFGKSDDFAGSVENFFTDALQLCQDIMSYLTGAFGYVSDVSTVKLTSIKNLLTCSSEILFESYQHCSKREECYGVYFSSLAESLMVFFKKAQDLQSCLLQLLSQAELDYEQYEIDILDESLTFIYKSGLALLNLNVKTMSDLWKGYTSLIVKHSNALKNNHDISVPIKHLAVNVIDDLSSFITETNLDPQKIIRTVKVSSFILKLIIKFIEHFNGCLRDCQSSLVNLIVILNKFSCPAMKILNCDRNSNELKQLAIAVDPLLNHIMNDINFVEEFSMACQTLKTGSSEKFPYLILCCTIMRKLTLSDSKMRRLWFDSEDNILEWTFHLISLCNYELCSDMKLPGVQIPGKPQKMVDCYEHLLTTISAFLVMSTSKEFALAEKLLIKYLLQLNPWCSLLSSDILCILARFAESDLCYNQLYHLCRIYLKLDSYPWTPQKIFLESLMQRLFLLLTQKHRDSLSESFPPEDHVILWHILGLRHLSAESIMSATNQLTIKRINRFVSNGAFRPSDFMEMEACLTSSDLTPRSDNPELCTCIATLWRFDAGFLTSNPLRKRYLRSLCSATSKVLRSMSSRDIFLVFKQTKEMMPNLNAASKLCCLENLEGLAEVVIPAGNLQSTTFRLISSLFYAFLTSDNVLVKCRSFEAFSKFAHATCHAELVSASINDNASLQAMLTNYFQRRHSTSEKEWNANEYAKKMEGLMYEHACNGDFSKAVDCDNDDSEGGGVEPSAKKFKLSGEANAEREDIDRIILAMRRDVVKVCRNMDALSIAQKRDLKFISDAIGGILK